MRNHAFMNYFIAQLLVNYFWYSEYKSFPVWCYSYLGSLLTNSYRLWNVLYI